MTTEPSPRVNEKVYAYITQGDHVLVFRHVDAPEAGIQVPGGTVQSGESLPEAVLREACEETGLAKLEIVSALGDTLYDMKAKGKPGEVHHRHFFHLRAAAPLPATWQHVERDPSDGGPPILFELFWAHWREQPLCSSRRWERCVTGWMDRAGWGNALAGRATRVSEWQPRLPAAEVVGRIVMREASSGRVIARGGETARHPLLGWQTRASSRQQ